MSFMEILVSLVVAALVAVIGCLALSLSTAHRTERWQDRTIMKLLAEIRSMREVVASSAELDVYPTGTLVIDAGGFVAQLEAKSSKGIVGYEPSGAGRHVRGIEGTGVGTTGMSLAFPVTVLYEPSDR